MAKVTQSDDAEPAHDAVSASSLTLLAPALWKRLSEARTSEDLATAWLALQCSMIPGASQGIVRVEAQGGGLRLLSAWPEVGDEPADLRTTSELALSEHRAVARGATADSAARPSVAFPIPLEDTVIAVVAVAIDIPNRAEAKDAMRAAIRQIQWGSAWLRDHLRGQRAVTSVRQLDRSRATLDLIASILDHQRFAPAAMAAATELAIRFDCARVSIGFIRRGAARVVAISHTAQFGRQMGLVRAIGAAMDEAIDQRCSILYPIGADEPIATHAHSEVSRLQQDGQVLTVPIFVVDAFIGAITFERRRDHAFEPESLQILDMIATAIGPILNEKRLNDRWLITKTGESLWQQVKRLLGPGHTGRKLAAVGLMAALAFAYFATDTYRVNADAQIEGSVRRAVISSYDGFIQEATARAGDVVKAGDELATLEDRELALERLRWATQRQQYSFEYDKALATRQPAAINIVKSQIEQADAQLKLIDEQIARTRIVAPFDGLIVSGDLSQRIGGSVSRGELLYEIAPLTDYRVVMQVDERQIADVNEGQKGEVIFASLPDERFDLTIGKITPVAQARDGKNLFQVEGSLTQASPRLRPGMIGIAKIAIDRRRLVSIWMRPVLEWWRLASWRWMS
ncbi:HlyD family efflux transporter periplasmic adaptor subunit [Aquamicrobium soli]|uniref:HlyD family efflux transporter periplasmic adaptor subunit n=1 Tax=Aquamicrobium soli TaxID=1811518 RepID=A0ABV7K7D2_9HYPH